MSSPRAPRRAHRWLPAVLLVLAAHGCVSEGELRPDSEPIDLGVAPPGSVLEGRLTVINAADGPATVTELIWTEDRAGAFFFPDERKSLSQTVSAGEQYSSTVRFRASSPGTYWGTLELSYSTRGGAVERVLRVGVAAGAEIRVDDLDGDGFTVEEGDCDDGDAESYPGASEICDGVDNDCDTFVPHDEEDADGDGYSPCEGDCADGDLTVYPGAPEGCDGIDTDCDGVIADDVDEDGDGLSPCHGDCDDGDPAIHPDATETCNGTDDDCDGLVDDIDGDGDGYLSADCGGGDDCDDAAPGIHPGALEICNGLDDDCDGALAGGEADVDGDGAMTCEGDCDDADPTVFPGASEVCNDVDDDCDGTVDPPDADDCVDHHADTDGDGFGDSGSLQCLCAPDPPYTVLTGGDCFDTNSLAWPGATPFHSQHRGDGSFDYDCDGSEEIETTELGSCGVDVLGLCYLEQEGWI
ncbi:MAG: MopE-related protein [Myxococcota bacterium]|nr:MopE-related protein [Myxococcota bacterium]